MSAPFVYEPLTDVHDRKAFICGDADLDNYLATKALQQQAKNLARVFVQRMPEDPPSLIRGFYTLHSHQIDAAAYPQPVSKGLPRNGLLSATLLGRFAIAQTSQHRGAGTDMLVEAMVRAFLSTNVASIGVTAQMKRADLLGFYSRVGFTLLPDSSVDIFVSMQTLALALAPFMARPDFMAPVAPSPDVIAARKR